MWSIRAPLPVLSWGKDRFVRTRKKKPIKTFHLILLTTLIGGAVSRGGRAEPPAVSMEDLVAQALHANPDLLAAEAQVAVMRGERRAAGQWKNPEATMEYGEKRVSNREGELTAKGNARTWAISQTFEFPGKASLRKAVAEKDVRLAELALEQLRLEIAAEARSLAIAWLAAGHEAAAAREVADRSGALVAMLAKRAPAGVQFLLEQRVIEASMVGIETRARESEEQRDEARIELNVLLARGAGEALAIQSPLDPPALPRGEEMLLVRAKSDGLVLKSRELELERADTAVDRARLEAAPDFTIGPFYSQETAVEKEEIVGLGISLPLPFWDSNRGGVDSARGELDRARANQLGSARDTERSLAREYGACRLAIRQLERTPISSLERLRDAADLADRQYRLGAVPVQTYLEMQEQYLEATTGILGALREAHDRFLRIQVLTADMSLLAPSEKKGQP